MKQAGGAAVIIMVTLLLWRTSYAYSCLSIVFPLLLLVVMFYGSYEYLVCYRKCRADCLFKQSSWLYAWMTRTFFLALRSLLIAIPLVLSLASFIILAHTFDILFILLSIVLTGATHPWMVHRLKSHTIEQMLPIISKRFTVFLSMIVMLVLYSWISYHLSIPSYVDATSLEHTISSASLQVASICYENNIILKFMQEIEAFGWYSMVVATQSVNSKQWITFAWIVFFINHAFVFAAISRIQVEITVWIQKASTTKGN